MKKYICIILLVFFVGCSPSYSKHRAVVITDRGDFIEYHFQDKEDLEEFVRIMPEYDEWNNIDPSYQIEDKRPNYQNHQMYLEGKKSGSSYKKFYLTSVPLIDELPDGELLLVLTKIPIPARGARKEQDLIIMFPNQEKGYW